MGGWNLPYQILTYFEPAESEQYDLKKQNIQNKKFKVNNILVV